MRFLPPAASALFVLIAVACGSSSGDSPSTPDPLASSLDAGTSSGTSGATSGGTSGGTSSGGPPTTDGSPIPYNQATLKTIHNAYDRDEPLIDQLIYDNVRSVEIDIHKGKGSDAPAGQWYVYHADVPTQDSTNCKFLDDCLGALAAFHQAMPNHEVVTVYIDLKDDFVPGHMPADLDDRFTKLLGRENIVTPSDMIGMCDGASTVRAAVAAPCKFPSLGSLRGKFIIAGTGGGLCDAASHASVYGGAKPSARIMFVAADLNDACPLEKYDAHPDIVFFNMSLDDKSHAQGVKDKGLIGRIYKGGLNGGLDADTDFNAARAAGAVQLATDKVNVVQDPWSTTTAKKGFPFLCDGCDTLGEATPLIGMTATSGDQWDKADSGFFGYEKDETESSWTALVSVESSHVEEFGKACLIARASEDPGAANVAFCRPFDNHPPRIQIRDSNGGTTSTEDAPAYPNYSDETAFFIRLTFKPDGATTAVDAQYSKDGKTFTSTKQAIVNSALPLRGISVSSHGSGKQHAYFANLTRNQPDLPAEKITAGKLTKKAIGAGASGDLVDGVVLP